MLLTQRVKYYRIKWQHSPFYTYKVDKFYVDIGHAVTGVKS